MNRAQTMAIEAIDAQQKKLRSGSAPWCVGEQLKEICRREPASAELLEKDLRVPEMDLRHAEKKIKEWADGHRSGSFAFVSPQKAEEILRTFYGLNAVGEDCVPENHGGVSDIIDLADFL